MSSDCLSDEEWSAIAKNLEDYHSVFSKFWSMGRPTITQDIPTCAVAFDKAGQQITWSINPTFWSSLSDRGKVFAIAHECMHVIFSHGVRATEMLKTIDPQTINAAMDIAVNSHLEHHYGFQRDEVEPKGVRYIWLDEVLPHEPAGKSFEYYVEALLDKNPQARLQNKNSSQRSSGGAASAPQTVDDHSGLGDFQGGDMAEMLGRSLDSGNTAEVAEMAGHDATPEMEKKAATVAKGLQAGKHPGNTVLEIASAKWIKRKPKWESVVKKWAMRAWDDAAEEQVWTQQNRRIDPAMMGDCMLPAPGESTNYEKKRIRVSFFLDTSGSCIHYATRFFNAARTLDPRRFEVKLYCFDTRVYETSLKSGQVYGGGGTSFSIIENKIQNEMAATGAAYPHAVWVLSDGYGNNVSPEKPKRWHWFLTANGSRDYGIHKDSYVHKLSDFE